MSTIELDAFEAFIEAMEYGLDRIPSGAEMGRVIRRLDDSEWQITRKPHAIVMPIEAAPEQPQAAAPIPPKAPDVPDEIPF